MRFEKLFCAPVERGYEFRIYNDDGNYRPITVSVESCWNLVEFVSDVERAKKQAQKESRLGDTRI